MALSSVTLLRDEDIELVEQIGNGSYGDVWRGRMKRDMSDIAVKQLKPLVDERATSSLVREVAVPNEFIHPAILPIKGWILRDSGDGKGPTLVMKYLEKGTLQNALAYRWENGEFPEGFSKVKLSCCLYGIADALALLHSKNFCHRDLKPQNILLDKDYHPYLCDYGFARFMPKKQDDETEAISEDKLTGTHHIGSPFYMAPELLDETMPYTQKIDVYAFGVTLYVCLINKGEYRWQNGVHVHKNALFRNVLNGMRLQRRPEIPEHFWELIEKCWARDPHVRPTFREICEILKTDKFCLDQAELPQYRQYVRMIDTVKKGYKLDLVAKKPATKFVFL